MSAVNVSEVVAKLSEFGIPEKAIYQAIKPLGLEVIPFSEEQAYHAGLLRTATQNIGVSLGDRACLSLAKMQKLTALTADRAWASLSIGVTIKVIR
jgi:PIN domain nuclease of toxin-antitoxin system